MRLGGSRASAQWGERIRVEGRLFRTEAGEYLLGPRDWIGWWGPCVVLRGVGEWWRPRRWRAVALAFTSHVVTVTGRATERFPSYATPGDPYHRSRGCAFGLEVERIELWR